jgi:transposase
MERIPKMPQDVYERLEPAAKAYVDLLYQMVVDLTRRVESLEAQLAKNSRNSSKPPSSDGLGKPKPQSNRVPSGKKPGGQSGHGGASLSQVDHPDEVIRHEVTECESCGLSVANRDVVNTEKRQVFDLPPLNLTVTEHQAELKRCKCGHVTTAQFPQGVSAPVQYGPNVCALAVYLSVYQFLPFKRMKEFFFDLLGMSISTGTIKRILETASGKVSKSVEAIKQSIIRSALTHFDETGMRVKKCLYWLHSSSTDKLTYYAVSLYRGTKAMEEIGILPYFRGKAIHDAWSPYYRFEDCFHFLCNAHHLRELKFVFEQHKEKWAGRMHKLLLKIHRVVFAYKAHGKDGLSTYRMKSFLATYQRIILAGKKLHGHRGDLEQSGSRGRKKQRKGKNLLDRLDQNQDQVLGFMKDFSIPFTNNQAERDIRMQKVKEKISGCFRTVKGAEDFARLRSYISTARKQGHPILEAIQQAITGQPLDLAAGT